MLHQDSINKLKKGKTDDKSSANAKMWLFCKLLVISSHNLFFLPSWHYSQILNLHKFCSLDFSISEFCRTNVNLLIKRRFFSNANLHTFAFSSQYVILLFKQIWWKEFCQNQHQRSFCSKKFRIWRWFLHSGVWLHFWNRPLLK